jgi:hypothetical protein
MPRGKDPRQPFVKKPGYGFADLLVLTAATKSNLQHWTKTNVFGSPILAAAIDDRQGKGHHRRFSAFNVIEAQLAATVNAHDVPAATIQMALNVLRHFHRQAVALYEQRIKAPLVTEPEHLALFDSIEARRSRALSYFRSRLPHPFLTENEVLEQARAIGEVWAYLRTGPLIRGEGDPSWKHFLALVISKTLDHHDMPFMDVVLDPTPLELQNAAASSAIFINLADVVFRVGERCKRLGVALEAW